MSTALRARYPLLFRKVFKKNFKPISAFLLVWILGAALVLKFVPFSAPDAGHLLGVGHTVWFMWVGVLLIVLLWLTGYEILYYWTYYYEMDDKNVTVRKGVIAKTEVTLPFNKITDVYVDQDMLDVAFGLWDLHISTPTVESGHLAHIDGLSKASAMELRDIILDRINRES